MSFSFLCYILRPPSALKRDGAKNFFSFYSPLCNSVHTFSSHSPPYLFRASNKPLTFSQSNFHTCTGGILHLGAAFHPHQFGWARFFLLKKLSYLQRNFFPSLVLTHCASTQKISTVPIKRVFLVLSFKLVAITQELVCHWIVFKHLETDTWVQMVKNPKQLGCLGPASAACYLLLQQVVVRIKWETIVR